MILKTGVCPECGSLDSIVTDSRYRVNNDSPYKYRRRECNDCSTPFSTYEVMVVQNMETTVRLRKGSIKIAVEHQPIFDQTAIDIVKTIKKEYGLE